MKKLVEVLNKIEEIFLVAVFALMVLVIFVQVVMRFLNNSLYWSEELGKFCFLWISWIGISIAERKGEHIKITMLVDKLPNRAAHAMNILSEIIVIIICAITVYYGVQLVGSQAGTTYAGIKISLAWGYLAVALGCGLMILRAIATAMASVKGLRTGEPLEHVLDIPDFGEGGEE